MEDPMHPMHEDLKILSPETKVKAKILKAKALKVKILKGRIRIAKVPTARKAARKATRKGSQLRHRRI